MEGSQYLHTPPSSEQDDGDSHADVHCYEPFDAIDDEVQEVDEEDPELPNAPPFAERSPTPPRQLKRARAMVAGKKPMASRLGQSLWEDTPDLAAYFAFFEDFDEAAQVKYCRAYANALSAKNPTSNRMRYSHKKRQ